MAEPAMIDEPVEAETVGLALLLSDTHAAIIAAGDEILALGQLVAQGIGTLPKAAVPLFIEPVAGQIRSADALATAAHSIEPTASARCETSDVAAAASVGPLSDASQARSTTAEAGGLPVAPSLPLAPSAPAWMGPPSGGLSSLPLPSTLAVPEMTPSLAPTSAIDYTAYAPASHAPDLHQISVVRNSVASHEQHPLNVSVSPTTPATFASPRPALPAAEATGVTPSMNAPAGASDTASSSVAMHGDVFLDGVRVGRWLSDKLARAANAPPSGSTAFDPRMGPSWPGAQQGH